MSKNTEYLIHADSVHAFERALSNEEKLSISIDKLIVCLRPSRRSVATVRVFGGQGR